MNINYKADATLIPVDSPNDVTKYTFDAYFRPINESNSKPGEFHIEGALLGNPYQNFPCVFTSATTIVMDRWKPGTNDWFLEVSGYGTFLSDKTFDIDIAVFDNRLGEKINEFQNAGVKIADIRVKFTPKE